MLNDPLTGILHTIFIVGWILSVTFAEICALNMILWVTSLAHEDGMSSMRLEFCSDMLMLSFLACIEVREFDLSIQYFEDSFVF